jgi:P-type E1-E2 ATPase
VSGRVHDREVWVGRGADGGVDVHVNGERIGTLTMTDAARSDAREVLRRLDRPVTMLSGDDPSVVAAVADALEVGQAYGGLLPEDKAAWIREAQRGGQRVLFAGDGLNDAAALSAADVSVAMGKSTSASLNFADVVLLTDSLSPLLAAREAAIATHAVLRQNVRAAIVYNVVAVSLAAAGWVGPLVAALLMPLSSAMVIGKALSIGRRVDRRASWTS